jgi:hypothetical protein
MSWRGQGAARSAGRAGEPPAAGALGGAALALATGASLAGAAAAGRRSPRLPAARDVARRRAARGLSAAAALLALSVLADSGLEHYRGGYRNPGMFTPLATSAATLLAATRPSRPGAALVFATALGVGAAGAGFHLFNIRKRPGGLNWLNLFYAAPLGAPAALSLAGLLGLAARAVRRGRDRILGVSPGRLLAALAGTGLAGTTAEAGLLHFRGSFQNPFMWLPVSLPPVGAVLLARAATEREAPHGRTLARAWLGLTAALGLGGVGFHVFGVSRAMGGWRNWRQNLIDGPPIPAPPAFSALAVAGLSALGLRDAEALA